MSTSTTINASFLEREIVC